MCSVSVLNPCQVYYSKKVKADGKVSWQGGRNLADSAEFTKGFCLEVFRCWVNRHLPGAAQPPRVQPEIGVDDEE